jgi:hypothetical protein
MLEAFLVDPVGLKTDLPHLVGVKEPPHDGVTIRMQLPLYIVHVSVPKRLCGECYDARD